MKKQLRAKERSHDLMYYASLGVYHTLVGNAAVPTPSRAPAVGGLDMSATPHAPTSTAHVYSAPPGGVSTPLSSQRAWTPRELQVWVWRASCVKGRPLRRDRVLCAW